MPGHSCLARWLRLQSADALLKRATALPEVLLLIVIFTNIFSGVRFDLPRPGHAMACCPVNRVVCTISSICIVGCGPLVKKFHLASVSAYPRLLQVFSSKGLQPFAVEFVNYSLHFCHKTTWITYHPLKSRLCRKGLPFFLGTGVSKPDTCVALCFQPMASRFRRHSAMPLVGGGQAIPPLRKVAQF